MEWLFVIVIGLCFGSFVTMASHRLPREQPIGSKRSHCPKCSHNLSFKDLWPVFSWLLSGGKCRHCAAPISPRYPLTELASAALLTVVYCNFALSAQSIILMLFSIALLTMLIADLETKIIPDEIHLFLIPLGILYHWHLATPVSEVAISTLLAGGLGLLLHYGYYWLRGFHGLGFGDVKFLFVVGLWLASANQLAVYVFAIGVLGILTGVLWRFISKEERFPFAPSLAVALWILVLWPSSAQVFWEGLRQLLG